MKLIRREHRMLDFYKGKRVLVTGHTGFKGAWMCSVLLKAGAELTGYALKPPTDPSLFALCGLSGMMHSVEGDVRDGVHLQAVLSEAKPEIVIHMAAQPLVIESYRDPVATYETNVMGTVNLLEAVRGCDTVRSVVNVTTDKVYLNREWQWGYRENEELNGFDPYSNSKSCSELVTSCYRNAFLQEKGVAVSTCRAGNVIGGGDFAENRILPDCVRAALDGEEIMVRNPFSVRPYQHVLEPIMAYLLLAQRQYQTPTLADCYNIGPEESGCVTTGELVSIFCETWNAANGTALTWASHCVEGPHEAAYLKLDCAKIRSVLGWKPVWSIREAVAQIVYWCQAYSSGGSLTDCMDRQTAAYLRGMQGGK